MLQIPHNKKGSAVHWIIGSIFLLIFIVLIIVGVMVAQQKGWFKKEQPQEVIPQIELFLKANEVGHMQNYFDANVEISYVNNEGVEVVAYNAKLNKDAYTPFFVPADRPINVRCWDANHYVTRAVKIHSARELEYNKSVMDCTTAKVGSLKVEKISGDLGHSFNTVVLNLTSQDGWWYKLGVCYEWTAGIIDVTSDNQWLVCDNGKWLNYTKYYPENGTYDWLPAGEYRCGEEQIEQCTEVSLSKCHLPEAIIPFRFSGIVDKCEYIGKTLEEGESYHLTLEIPTIDNKNSLDYVAITFYDHDRRFEPNENRWIWMSAKNSDNLGAPDQEYTIYYKLD